MQKEKKITVKFFLNKKVPAPHRVSDPENTPEDKMYYALYVQVTYNRKNTQFKSILPYSINQSEITEPYNVEIIEFQKSYIIRIINYMSKLMGEKYTLRGLNRDYEFFTKFISRDLEERAYNQFLFMLHRHPSDFKILFNRIHSGEDIYFDIKLNAAEILIPDFYSELTGGEFKNSGIINLFKSYTSFFTVIRTYEHYHKEPRMLDWLEGLAQKELIEKNKTSQILTKEQITDLIENLDRYIAGRLNIHLYPDRGH